jgi:hypothetical protein
MKEMANKTVENVKSDLKKGVADIEKAGTYVKADAKADISKMNAKLGHDDLGKNVAYAKADIKADAEKANADVKDKIAHVKADLEKKR